MVNNKCESVVHVRFEGKSYDIPKSILDIGARSSNKDILRTLARKFDVNSLRLDDYVVERHNNGNISVRPEAVFG